MPTTISVVTDAEWATLQNPMILDALQFPGADAGQKIAAAIAALPVGVGGLVNAYFPNPQNATGFTIPPGVTVQLSPVLFTLIASGPSITVNQGGRLKGSGTNAPGDTRIKASNGFNKDLIRCVNTTGIGDSDYWHHGIVSDLRIDGNKANNTTGNGIAIYALAEVSDVKRLNIFNCAQAGMYIKGSQSGTGSIRNVTVNTNGLAGVQVDEFRSGLTLYNVGGDLNPLTLLVTNPKFNGGCLQVIDLKSEAASGPVVKIQGGSSRMILKLDGGNFLCPQGVDSIGIQIAADVSSDPLILVSGLATGNTMPVLIDDLKHGSQFLVDPLAYHGRLEYCGGKSTYFDFRGLKTIP